MIIDHLATYFDAQWPYDNAQAVTREITQADPHYAGMTWDALGDQGLQWDAFGAAPRSRSAKDRAAGLADGRQPACAW